jgi:hypothetical protein
MFIHTVYFWLKDGVVNTARQKLIADCYKYLKPIPTVRQLWAGAPAMTPRDVVDNSYQVGLTVVLDDEAGHDIYQKHAMHLDFIAQNKDHWRRVQVYDFKA